MTNLNTRKPTLRHWLQFYRRDVVGVGASLAIAIMVIGVIWFVAFSGKGVVIASQQEKGIVQQIAYISTAVPRRAINSGPAYGYSVKLKDGSMVFVQGVDLLQIGQPVVLNRRTHAGGDVTFKIAGEGRF